MVLLLLMINYRKGRGKTKGLRVNAIFEVLGSVCTRSVTISEVKSGYTKMEILATELSDRVRGTLRNREASIYNTGIQIICNKSK